MAVRICKPLALNYRQVDQISICKRVAQSSAAARSVKVVQTFPVLFESEDRRLLTGRMASSRKWLLGGMVGCLHAANAAERHAGSGAMTLEGTQGALPGSIATTETGRLAAAQRLPSSAACSTLASLACPYATQGSQLALSC